VGAAKKGLLLCVYKGIKFMTDEDVAANIGMSKPPYKNIDGYRYINIFVRFTQKEADEPPVDLGVIFAFNSGGEMGARRYANLEENLLGPQSTNFIDVSGSGSWHGSQWKISCYMARFPVMGPYVQVFVYNRAAVRRKVSVWAYLVS
jgi:hypothetical protein